MNVNLTSDLWRLYEESVFKFNDINVTDGEFCVITGCNPLGKLLTASKNYCLNRELAHDLRQLNLSFSPLIAGNKTFSHVENSFKVSCDKAQAVALGRKWRQNAIYWIKDDLLYLLPCCINDHTEHKFLETFIGSFQKRITLGSCD
ncbi:MAG: DUF3293 domain-containing protein [Psychrobium sp.]|nr:DUF3293 domain-containing protein [Psychrobium sp.]